MAPFLFQSKIKIMAILKKGIMGTPRGKIANIMGYERLSRGILQSLPHAKDPYTRYWNLLKWKLTERLTEYWNFMQAGFQATWNAAAPAGMSGFDFYLSYSLDQVLSIKGSRLYNLPFEVNASKVKVEMSIIGSWEGRELYFDIPDDDVFWTQAGFIRFELTFYKIAGGSTQFLGNWSDTGPRPLRYVFDNAVDDTYGYFVIRVRHLSNSTQYLTLQSDIYNPILDLPIS